MNATCPWEPPQMRDVDSPGFQPSFQAFSNSAQEELSGRRQKEGEADQVSENPRGEEKGTPQQDGKPVQECTPGKPAVSQLSPDLPEGSKPLQTSQSRPGDTREYHQSDGRPNTHPLADLNQDEQLQERDPDKEEEKPAEQ